MELSEVRYLASRPSYASPTIGANGVWASAGAHALRSALTLQSAQGVMDLLKSMDVQGMADVLRETGFPVAEHLVAQGRNALFGGVRNDLQAALSRGVDGHGLQQADSAKTLAPVKQDTPARVGKNLHLGSDFAGDPHAAHAVQAILQAPQVRVIPLGDQPVHQRASLQMIAAQALQKEVLGFGFDGVPGKFEVPVDMAEVVELHRHAAREVATESTRAGLLAWASGRKVTQLSEWVPDSVQRLLNGSVFHDAAEVVVSGLNSGSIARHAQEYGAHGITRLLAQKGLDVNAPTLAEQAREMGVQIKEPDRERGQYFGTVVAQDHRASLIKVNRDEGVELPFGATPGARPKVGEALRLDFNAGVLNVSTKSQGREGRDL